jgi:2-hydroxy-3-keto-5-methylthiopentenyl-1-phosphate phosphatase
MKKETTQATVAQKPRMAICYDFDRTLSPDDMQSFTLIPSFGIDKGDFWHGSDHLAEEHLMDKNLAWMFELIKYSRFKGKSLSRDYFRSVGKDVPLYKGVEEWFTFVNEYAESKGIEVEHYIISSGLKEIIEGNPIAKYIKRIYASSFLYSADGIAEWPAQSVNYTNKTQFIFRIAKGILEEYDERVNDNMPHSKYAIPYENFVYIGDSSTDIPCMTLIRSKGGYSIGVFDPVSKNKKKVYQLFNDDRINFYAPARYSKDSPIADYIRQIIDEVALREAHRATEQQLKAPAEAYRRRMMISRAFSELDIDMPKEERETLEKMLGYFDEASST